jgi:hypothetical protein
LRGVVSGGGGGLGDAGEEERRERTVQHGAGPTPF